MPRTLTYASHRVESDRAFFEQNAGATSRVRPPFPGELAELCQRRPPRGHTAIVIIAFRRDPRSGEPLRGRGVVFLPVQ